MQVAIIQISALTVMQPNTPYLDLVEHAKDYDNYGLHVARLILPFRASPRETSSSLSPFSFYTSSNFTQ